MPNRPLSWLTIALLGLAACDEADRCDLQEDGRCASASRRSPSDPMPGVDGGLAGGVDAAPITVPDSGVQGAGLLAGGLALSEIAVYQAVKIAVMRDGAPVEPRNAPVIQRRPALIRVFVRPLADWQQREVAVRLTFESATAVDPMEVRQVVSGASSDTDPNSTFNFFLEAEQVTGDLAYQVRIEEVGAAPGGDTSGAAYPATGTTLLAAQDAGESVRVVVVPIRYTAGGGAIMPDISPAQIERLRLGMYKIFPTPRVEMTVHDPVDWSETVSARGTGWSNLLQAVLNLRQRDNVATNVYYYGLVTPAESFRSFCGRGCVAGLSTLSMNPADDYVRGSIGLGYTGDDAVGTFIHEVGHAHGRQHAPCGIGPQPADPGYPYPNADIGVWGYDSIDRRLLSPTQNKDLMGYCDPRWISDYQFAALYERISYVNSIASWIAPPNMPRRWRSVMVDADGVSAWSPPIELRAPPGGESRQVPVVDDSGHIVGTTEAFFYPYSHIEGGMWLVPEPSDPSHHAVIIEGTRRIVY